METSHICGMSSIDLDRQLLKDFFFWQKSAASVYHVYIDIKMPCAIYEIGQRGQNRRCFTDFWASWWAFCMQGIVGMAGLFFGNKIICGKNTVWSISALPMYWNPRQRIFCSVSCCERQLWPLANQIWNWLAKYLLMNDRDKVEVRAWRTNSLIKICLTFFPWKVRRLNL